MKYVLFFILTPVIVVIVGVEILKATPLQIGLISFIGWIACAIFDYIHSLGGR